MNSQGVKKERKKIMKKISVLSVFAVLTMPVFAVEDVQKLYGNEPDEPVASECIVPDAIVAQYEKQFKNAKNTEEKQIEQASEIKKVKEIKEIEEVKTVKEVKKVENQPKPKESPIVEAQQTQEIKTVSNPKTRFPHGLQFGVGLSPTSGLDGFIGYNNKKFDSFWAKRFGIRFDFATMSPIKNTLNKRINHYVDDHGGIEIGDTLKIDNIKLNAKHYGAMIDFYPFGDTWFLGGWRVSGGYFMGKLDLDADIHGAPDDGKIEFELNEHKYYYVGNEMHAKAMADWKYNGPYLGTGFDLGLFWGFKIYFDAGVVFTGSPAKFDLDVPIDGLENAAHVAIVKGSAEHDQFIKDKNKEIEDARKEIKDYPYYPLVKLGFMYRF